MRPSTSARWGSNERARDVDEVQGVPEVIVSRRRELYLDFSNPNYFEFNECFIHQNSFRKSFSILVIFSFLLLSNLLEFPSMSTRFTCS